MTNSVKAVLGAVILVIIVGGVFFAVASNKADSSAGQNTTSQPASTSTSPAQKQPVTSTPDTATVAGTISYNGSSFSPSSLTVKVGDTIKIANQSSTALSFNSNPHPVHTDEPELNVGAIDAGQSKTFKVTKLGSWGYHNHLNPSQTGTIVVQ